MEKNNNSGWNLGLGLGLGALVGVLVSAIIGMLRISKPKNEGEKIDTTIKPASPKNLETPTSSLEMKQPAKSGPQKNEMAVETTTSENSTSWSAGTKYFVY